MRSLGSLPLFLRHTYHVLYFFFFFNDTATTEIYTLSLHDALPISDDDALDRAHHAALDQRVEPAPIEVVVMGDDRDVEAVAAPGDQRRRADVAERVRPEEVEAGPSVEPPDEGREEDRRDRPAQPAPDRQPVDGPVRDTAWIALVTGQEDLDRMPRRAEVAPALPLVRLPARGRLGIDAAVGRADPHGASPGVATSST